MNADAPLANLGPPALELSSTFARVKGMLLTNTEAALAVESLAHVVRDMVDTPLGAGASLIEDHGRPTSTGSTDGIVAAADALQYELWQGPCISAWTTSSVQRIVDTSDDPRWPDWCEVAQHLGIRSVLSGPLVFRGESIGTLKVYSRAVDAFTDAHERRLVLLAGAVATLLGAAQDHEGPQRLSTALRSALRDRQAVDTATGIMMERGGMTFDEARDGLLRASRAGARPIADLARQIVAGSADLPL